MEEKVLVETKNLSVTFPMKKESIFEKRKYLKAVSDVSIKIMKGETFGLVGESGCGKSTFANTTLCFAKLSNGELFFDGIPLSKADKQTVKKVRQRMQKIFQDPAASLNPRFTVYDAVSEPLRLRKEFNESEIHERTLEMIKSVGLGENDLKRFTFEFSGGQQQRIAIARALILNPEYIVCDEPVSALDVSVHAQIFNLLMELQKKTGVTYLFISHNLAVVKQICQRIAIMYFGKVVEYGDTEKIFANPAHPYTRTLLSAILPMNEEEEEHQKKLKEMASEDKEELKNMTQGELELVEIEENHFVAYPKGRD